MEQNKATRKTFQDLTIKDSFMFAAVMSDEECCHRLLEMILGMKVLSLYIHKEDVIVYHSEYHGIRLDILAEESSGEKRRFNVEMQVQDWKNLPHRCRYYHAQLDMHILPTGSDYNTLPDTFVIFICDYDPFGDRLYRYTYQNRCDETGKALQDGLMTVILSTRGENSSEVPSELVKFLKYVKKPKKETAEELEDDFVNVVEGKVQSIKKNRSWEERYMLLKETLYRERADGMKIGRAEESVRQKRTHILKLLSHKGSIPDVLRSKIEAEEDSEKLEAWFDTVIDAKSVEDFSDKIGL